jgi:peptidylprolyl isomerase
MRLKALVAVFTGLFMAGTLAAAQAPVVPAGPPPLDPENTLLLDLSTGGRVTIQLRPDVAPGHVERMKTLARRGFYNGLTFHRVIEGFMAQGGDPKGDGTGGSDLPDLKAEFNRLPHLRGALSAARSEPVDSANSQFFLMLAPRLSLDGRYTVYGRVVSGMNFVDAIEKGEPPANPSRILQASIAADNKAPPAGGQTFSAAPGLAPADSSAGRAAGPAVPPPPSIRLPEAKRKAPPKKTR